MVALRSQPAPRLAKSAGPLGVLAVAVLGGPLVDAALRVPAGAPLDLVPGVRMVPLRAGT